MYGYCLISELARKFSITARTLRYYEEERHMVLYTNRSS
ncbi:MerR family DNA-binding transcriptional regulator [Bartonella phoceensis]|nr:MerR family DNA-binding transcriptional regulator [Bartonella phoceensis]